jgi:hypothetical protein
MGHNTNTALFLTVQLESMSMCKKNETYYLCIFYLNGTYAKGTEEE